MFCFFIPWNDITPNGKRCYICYINSSMKYCCYLLPNLLLLRSLQIVSILGIKVSFGLRLHCEHCKSCVYGEVY